MTYNASAVSDTAIAFQKPITLQQGRALRDNPLAVFEGDASAPLSLLPTVHLGTITGNGSAQTLTGLDLTPFKGLRIVWNGVATSIGFGAVTIAQVGVNSSSPTPRRGIITYDLQSGIFSGVVAGSTDVGAATTYSVAGLTTITTATTSISATAFSTGSASIYGLK